MSGLSAQQVQLYQREGALFPLAAIAPEEICEHLHRLEAMEAKRAGRLPPALNVKAHLLIPWLWDLVHDARVLGLIEPLLGSDLLCLGSNFFAKRSGDPHHVPWHQDVTYWGLSEPRALTAWIAFTASVPENGCLRVIPCSHRQLLPHREVGDKTSMLPIGEEIVGGVDESVAVDVVLAPGQLSMHHVSLVHGSLPNRSGPRRVGFAVRYVAGDLWQTGRTRGTATLVRGKDHGYFDLEEPPAAEFDTAAMERYRLVLGRWMTIVTDQVDEHRKTGGSALRQ